MTKSELEALVLSRCLAEHPRQATFHLWVKESQPSTFEGSAWHEVMAALSEQGLIIARMSPDKLTLAAELTAEGLEAAREMDGR